MAFTGTDLVAGAAGTNSFSIGPLKLQILTYTLLSTDTSATVTFDKLNNVYAVLSDGGFTQSAAATFATNVATLAFTTAAAATGYGFIIGIGN